MIVLKAAQEKFLSALQAVSGIVERRHTLPILANVLIRKTGPTIEFTTSDLEIQVRTSAELGGDGEQLRDHGRRAQADRHPALAAGRPDGDADRRRRTSSPLQAARAASRCRRCRPTTSRWCRKSADFGPMFSVPQKTLKQPDRRRCTSRWRCTTSATT